jgi:hypothetical protein
MTIHSSIHSLTGALVVVLWMLYLYSTSAEPPPENVRRLQVLIDPTYGILRTKEFADVKWDVCTVNSLALLLPR